MKREVYAGQQEKAQPTCGFCGRRLSGGFYYLCHVCGATYCYAHKPDRCDHRKANVPPMSIISRRKA